MSLLGVQAQPPGATTSSPPRAVCDKRCLFLHDGAPCRQWTLGPWPRKPPQSSILLRACGESLKGIWTNKGPKLQVFMTLECWSLISSRWASSCLVSTLTCGFVLQLHMAEHPAGHLVLKWLIEQDMTLAEAGKEGRNAAVKTVYRFCGNIWAFSAASLSLCSSPRCGRLRAVQQDTGGHSGCRQAEELGQSQQRSHGALQVSFWIISPFLSMLSSAVLAALNSWSFLLFNVWAEMSDYWWTQARKVTSIFFGSRPVAPHICEFLSPSYDASVVAEVS